MVDDGEICKKVSFKFRPV